MPKRITPEEAIGLKFGKAVVTGYSHQSKHSKSVVWARCECGTEFQAILAGLKSGNTTSCGCYLKQRIKETKTKHGLWGTPEYFIWLGIKDRCFNVNDEAYPDYGGRGITMWEGWIADFKAFLDHIGPRPTSKHMVERIDNNQGYVPGNVKWALNKEQARNRRSNVLYTFNGVTLCQQAWAEAFGRSIKSVRSRLTLGWSIEEALATPSGCKGANRSVRATQDEFEAQLAIALRNVDIHRV